MYCVRIMPVMEVNTVFSVVVDTIKKICDGIMCTAIVPGVMKQTHVIRVRIHL